jgi:hypothetical protein
MEGAAVPIGRFFAAATTLWISFGAASAGAAPGCIEVRWWYGYWATTDRLSRW